MHITTPNVTILKLCTIFALYGLTSSLISDIRRCLIHYKNNIKLIFSASYHPATKGQAERVLKTSKNAMKTILKEPRNWQTKLQNFLLYYRITLHTLTGEHPVTCSLNRIILTKLDILRPNLKENVTCKVHHWIRSFHNLIFKSWKRYELEVILLHKNLK